MAKIEYYTSDEVVDIFRREIEKAGSQKAWARKHKLSEPWVSDVLNKKREPSGKILGILGFQPVKMFISAHRTK